MKEATIKDAIMRELKARKIFSWRNGAGPYAPSGLPDIQGILPGGRTLGFEVKTPEAYRKKDHDLRSLQMRWLIEAKSLGALAECVCSVEQVREILDREGYQRGWAMSD